MSTALDVDKDTEELLQSPTSSSASSSTASSTPAFGVTRQSVIAFCIGAAAAVLISVLMFNINSQQLPTSSDIRQLIIPDESPLQQNVQCSPASNLQQYNYSEWLSLGVQQRFEYAQNHPQPLPYCHNYNSRLQQSIMHWLHEVQIPAVEQLKQHNTTSNGFFIFEVIEWGTNGGFIDRQRGMMSTLMWAWAMNRPFAIRYNYPAPLHDALECNLLDWNLDEWLLPLCPKTKDQKWWQLLPSSAQCSHLSIIDNDGNHEILDKLLNEVPRSTSLLFNANGMWFNNLMSHPVLGPRLREFGLINNTPFFNHWACISELLYMPQMRSINMIQKSLSHIGYQLVWPSFSATPSKATAAQLLEYQRSLPAFAPAPLLLPLNNSTQSPSLAPTSLHCLQYRHGVGSAFRDNSEVATLETLDHAVNMTVAAVAEDLKLGLQPLVFVSSDSIDPKPLDVMTAALNLMTAVVTEGSVTVHAFEVEGIPNHVDMPVTDDTDADIKVVADNWMLGLCQHAIVTSSGFGISGVWRTSTAIDRWYIIPSYYEVEKNQISRVYQVR